MQSKMMMLGFCIALFGAMLGDSESLLIPSAIIVVGGVMMLYADRKEK